MVERRNQTVIGMARSMMKAKKMPTLFWGEAVTTAVFILNRAPTKALKGKTPFEAWHGRKPNVSIWLHWPCQEHKAPPRQAGGQKHTHGAVGLRGGQQGLSAL